MGSSGNIVSPLEGLSRGYASGYASGLCFGVCFGGMLRKSATFHQYISRTTEKNTNPYAHSYINSTGIVQVSPTALIHSCSICERSPSCLNLCDGCPSLTLSDSITNSSDG